MSTHSTWPDLNYKEHQDALETLHLITQIVGKVRLHSTPWLNHSWHVPLYVSVNGLTTGLISLPAVQFELELDFITHHLRVNTTEGAQVSIPLAKKTIADFYGELMQALSNLGISIKINEFPNEIADPIAFSQDLTHADYEPEYTNALWRAMLPIDRVFKTFRTGFLGKASPVHFFWGSFDLAVTRFSGKPAPLHPGGIPNLPDAVTREAYSHEVSSAGFWPGGGEFDEPAFYAYAYPTPPHFAQQAIEPKAAYFHESLGEFILPYRVVASSPNPEDALMRFLNSSYSAAAKTGQWSQESLDCEPGEIGKPRRI